VGESELPRLSAPAVEEILGRDACGLLGLPS
jgi:hypothetical protein